MEVVLAEPAIHVQILWNKLAEMEQEHRFGGREYPAGTVKFPFRLPGQGFFPGGDGLWREDKSLAVASDGLIPRNGVLFLGNDFGSLQSFAKLNMYENPLTWRNLKARVRTAGINPRLVFCTNAFLGLREDRNALDKKVWACMPEFCHFCAEFLRFQLEQVRPRLVVLMGPHAQAAFDRLSTATRMPTFHVFSTTHPYGDFNFNQDRRVADARALAQAWAQS